MKNILMVGAGRVGQLHTNTIHSNLGGRARVVGIVDPAEVLSAELADAHGIKNRHTSLAEALREVDCDGVVITTPTFTHSALTVAALEAGKHVHLEKPMAMNLQECRDIEAAAAASGTSVQLGFMRRFDADFQALAAAISSGALGHPMIISSRIHGPGLPPKWAYTLHQSNGMIAEVNSHDMDTVAWFAGSRAVSIQASVANNKGHSLGIGDPNFYDTLVASIRFENGALANVTGVCPCDYGYDSRAEVIGTKGGMAIGSLGATSVTSWSNETYQLKKPIVRSWRTRFAAAYVEEMREFVDVMKGATARVGTAEGSSAVELVLAGTLSFLEGRVVELDEVRDEAFVPEWQAVS